jgi:DNA polymerase
MILLDLETRGYINVVKHGVYEHVKDPALEIISLAYALDKAPPVAWRGMFSDGETLDTYDPDPAPLLAAIEAGEEVWAWNAAYELHVWNAVAKDYGWPLLALEQMRDAAVLAAYYNLPRALKNASLWLNQEQQKLSGTSFKWLWDANNPLTDADAPMFNDMVDYNLFDIHSMRGVLELLPTAAPAHLWEDYQVNERVNDRGVIFDRDLAERILELRHDIDAEQVALLDRLTDGAVTTPRGPQAREWTETLLETHAPELLHKDTKTLARAFNKRRTDGVVGFHSVVRETFDKDMRRHLREEILDLADPALDPVLEMLDIVDEGAQAAITKYEAAYNRTDDLEACLRGQYVFCGASQTHRYSSHGVQIHNLLRDTPKPARYLEIRAAIMDGTYADLPEVQEKGLIHTISTCLRPSLMAEPGCLLKWGDFSSIEARGLPWLANSPGAERVLDIFRAGKDIYVQAAIDIFGSTPDDQDDPDYKYRRQVGKVAILSLGYGGGIGAFVSMGRNYGISLERAMVKRVVGAWREANPWATRFWEQLDRAATNAVRHPGETFAAGRVEYFFAQGLLGGTLICSLPCGNMLFYPSAAIEMVSRFAKKKGEPEELQPAVVFTHPTYGRSSLWHGLLAENNTQAICASLLRHALRQADRICTSYNHPGGIVLHTHDELVLEVQNKRKTRAQADRILTEAMGTGPSWAEGLPLDIEIGSGSNYYLDGGNFQ